MASKKSGAKKAQRSTSNVFAMFEQNQINEFKEAFQLIDNNKDGIIDKDDLRMTFDALGRIVDNKDLDEMMTEAPGPITFTMFLTIFGDRISGSDPEEVILNAFKTFDLQNTGKIDEKNLKASLCKWGEKLNAEEVEQAFGEAPHDAAGLLDYNAFTRLITRGKDDDQPAA
jgi:Ca2+-binding EF-hand superfamily protein